MMWLKRLVYKWVMQVHDTQKMGGNYASSVAATRPTAASQLDELMDPRRYGTRSIVRIASGFLVMHRIENKTGHDHVHVTHCATPEELTAHIIADFVSDQLKGKP